MKANEKIAVTAIAATATAILIPIGIRIAKISKAQKAYRYLAGIAKSAELLLTE